MIPLWNSLPEEIACLTSSQALKKKEKKKKKKKKRGLIAVKGCGDQFNNCFKVVVAVGVVVV